MNYKEAVALGAKTYDGVCKHHGAVKFYTSNRSCLCCLRANFYTWRKKHAERMVAERRAWAYKNPAKALLQGARRRAKKSGLAFELTADDIIIPDRCPVFGFELSRGGGTDNSPSIDRIDNAKGYLRGNVVVVSMLANRIKNNSTTDQLKQVVEFYEKLTNRYSSIGEPPLADKRHANDSITADA
jgi:hypothetical protein